jgi:hypothetical protein
MERDYAVTNDYFRAVNSANLQEYVMDKSAGKPYLYMDRERGFDGGSLLQIATIGFGHIPQLPLVQKDPQILSRKRMYWESEPFIYDSDILTIENKTTASQMEIPDSHKVPVSLWARARGESQYLHDTTIVKLQLFTLDGSYSQMDLTLFYMLETYYNYNIQYRNVIRSNIVVTKDANSQFTLNVFSTVSKFREYMKKQLIFNVNAQWLLKSVLGGKLTDISDVYAANDTNTASISKACKEYIMMHLSDQGLLTNRDRLIYWWCILPHRTIQDDNYNYVLFAIAYAVEHKVFPTWSLYEQSKVNGNHMNGDSDLFRTTANPKFMEGSYLASLLDTLRSIARIAPADMQADLNEIISALDSTGQGADNIIGKIDTIANEILKYHPTNTIALQWREARKAGKVTLREIEEYIKSTFKDEAQSDDSSVGNNEGEVSNDGGGEVKNGEGDESEKQDSKKGGGTFNFLSSWFGGGKKDDSSGDGSSGDGSSSGGGGVGLEGVTNGGIEGSLEVRGDSGEGGTTSGTTPSTTGAGIDQTLNDGCTADQVNALFERDNNNRLIVNVVSIEYGLKEFRLIEDDMDNIQKVYALFNKLSFSAKQSPKIVEEKSERIRSIYTEDPIFKRRGYGFYNMDLKTRIIIVWLYGEMIYKQRSK